MSDTRDILIKYSGRKADEIVTIPADYKVTFGPFSPASSMKQAGMATRGVEFTSPKTGWTLRIYESKDKQRAVFTNVNSFRDLSLPLRRRIVIPSDEDIDKIEDDAQWAEVTEHLPF